MDKKTVLPIIVGAIVTIIVSIGGSYITTQITLATHDVRIQHIESKVNKVETKLESNSEILNRIDKNVAVINERTKQK